MRNVFHSAVWVTVQLEQATSGSERDMDNFCSLDSLKRVPHATSHAVNLGFDEKESHKRSLLELIRCGYEITFRRQPNPVPGRDVEISYLI